MASIGTQLPTTSTTGTSSTSTSSGTATAAADPLANENTFLQLLVSQLKYQDPSQPVDGTTFVTQLAQFSTLEQELASRQDLDSISQDLTGSVASAASGTSSTGTTATTGTTGTTTSTGTTSTSGS
jgi:flagellar basal-body rod modification protein FlgD